MNFERFAHRIVSSADKALSAAQSFKGLDSLAAQDEYIHSDGLNVRRRETENSQSQLGAKQSSSLQDRTALSPARPLTLPPPRIQPQPLGSSSNIPSCAPPPPLVTDSKHDRHHSDVEFNRSQSMPLSSSETERSKRSTKRQGTMPLMSSGDDSDEDRNDLGLVRTVAPRKTQQTTQPVNANTALQTDMDSDSASERTQERRRNAKRFLEDLDAHISRPMKPMNIEVEAPAPPPPVPVPERPSWPWSGIGTQAAAPTPAVAPLLARTRKQQKSQQQQQQQLDTEESFHVVTSAAMLADDELAQLQALKTSSEGISSSWTSRLWSLGREHPRESFVVLTLVLGILAYFYTRAWTEDDVT